MKAAVTTRPGQPDVIELQEKPKPTAKPEWVVIRVKAFGLNRSELFTRQGHSPGVNFPITQGIECVGEIEEDPSGLYQPGQKVAACMGGMGWQAIRWRLCRICCCARRNCCPIRERTALDHVGGYPGNVSDRLRFAEPCVGGQKKGTFCSSGAAPPPLVCSRVSWPNTMG